MVRWIRLALKSIISIMKIALMLSILVGTFTQLLSVFNFQDNYNIVPTPSDIDSGGNMVISTDYDIRNTNYFDMNQFSIEFVVVVFESDPLVNTTIYANEGPYVINSIPAHTNNANTFNRTFHIPDSYLSGGNTPNMTGIINIGYGIILDMLTVNLTLMIPAGGS